MAACESLQHIFNNPLDPAPAFSCKNIAPVKSIVDSPTDVFTGVLNLSETSDLLLSTAESLQESLGYKTFDNVNDFNGQRGQGHKHITKHAKTNILGEHKRFRINGKEIPPPISSIGRRVCFKSYRCNGRLVIKEEKMLTHEVLHAYREGGRLKLRCIRFDDGMEAKRENEIDNSNGKDGVRCSLEL